jgi:putative colanic acid biosynthesis acetyltransferase WcaF
MSTLDARTSNPTEGGPSFSLKNRLLRGVWGITWLLLAAWTPPPLRAWRRFLLRLFGAMLYTFTPGPMQALRSNLKLERNACIGPGVNVYNMAPITLGEYAIASQGVHLCAGTHDIEDEHFQLKSRPITLGKRAWVAAEAFVGPGVTIGEGAVLGARGCAFRDLEPWTVYTGNPAQPLRKRQVRFGQES